MNPSGRRWWVLANVVLVNVIVIGIAWNYLIMFVPALIRDLGLEISDWGTLWAGIALGVLVFSFPAGVAGDRVGARASLTAGLVLAALFALHASERASLWRGETWLLLDAAEHYPEGSTASFLRARRAAQERDPETAVMELRRATERGIDRFTVLLSDRALAPIHGDPGFQALVDELAGRWIERAQRRGVSTQAELRMLALAHLQRGELDSAVLVYEGALAAGGPLDPVVRTELETVRARRERNRHTPASVREEAGHPAGP